MRGATLRRQIVASLLLAGLVVAISAPERPARAASGDELLIVDCLLPGKVRKLGRQATFMTARRAIRTSASDCEIRGGEYTAHDRANYATALKIWLPLAEAGDAAAQANVGEIYEKGLGVEPQYELAAAWYLKAANAGFARAQLNLGALYERGLGVPQDMAKAVAWYRRASGLSEQNIAYVPSSVRQELEQLRAEREQLSRERESLTRERDALRAELAAVRQQLERARQELRQQHGQTSGALRELESARAELERQQKLARGSGNDAEVKRLQAALDAKAADADRKRQELDRLRQRVVDLNGQATQLETALQRARDERQQDDARRQDRAAVREAELRETMVRLQAAEAELARIRADADRSQGEAERIRAALAQEQSAAKRDARKIGKLEAELAVKENALAERDQRLAELDGEIGSLRRESEALKQERAATPSPSPAPQVAGAAPVIEMIEPPVVLTRLTDPTSVGIKATEERLIVGRVKASAGLIALMVNDAEQQAGEDGLFKVKVKVSYPETPVRIVAIDGGGGRAELEFTMKPDAKPAAAPAKSTTVPAPGSLDFGPYHALVIGNNDYRFLPKLQTAETDARAVAEVLKQRYGFKVTLLLNADRYAILSTLNKLRAELTEDDNLLIYYAGHGELDRVNDRGHWLPVDAEPDSSANWISNIQITDVLNAMLVKQVMVVADSCYSGTLTRAALAQLDPGMSADARYKWIKVMASKRARVMLSSGGVQPVLDSGGGEHSVFARAFLESLQRNAEVMEGQRLYHQVSQSLADSAAGRVEQIPRYAPIKYAGHEAGDFFFVPVAN